MHGIWLAHARNIVAQQVYDHDIFSSVFSTFSQVMCGEKIRLGDAELEVMFSPGHTEGSVSYLMKLREGGRLYHVVIANMGRSEDGLVRALDSRSLFANATTAGYLAEAEMQHH